MAALWLSSPAAAFASCADFGVDEQAAIVPASGPQAGTGTAAQPPLPATVAEAEAAYAETVRKCGLLTVVAVRDECLRQAKRTLDRDLARLNASQRGG